MVNYSKEELENALQTISSMIKRSENVQQKLKTGSPQSSLTINRLKALYISSAFISKELNKDNADDMFTREDLEKALFPLISTINNCVKVREKLKESSPQFTLTEKMIKALSISLSLIRNELDKND